MLLRILGIRLSLRPIRFHQSVPAVVRCDLYEVVFSSTNNGVSQKKVWTVLKNKVWTIWSMLYSDYSLYIIPDLLDTNFTGDNRGEIWEIGENWIGLGRDKERTAVMHERHIRLVFYGVYHFPSHGRRSGIQFRDLSILRQPYFPCDNGIFSPASILTIEILIWCFGLDSTPQIFYLETELGTKRNTRIDDFLAGLLRSKESRVPPEWTIWKLRTRNPQESHSLHERSRCLPGLA